MRGLYDSWLNKLLDSPRNNFSDLTPSRCLRRASKSVQSLFGLDSPQYAPSCRKRIASVKLGYRTRVLILMREPTVCCHFTSICNGIGSLHRSRLRGKPRTQQCGRHADALTERAFILQTRDKLVSQDQLL
jgi:hypothetical protein